MVGARQVAIQGEMLFDEIDVCGLRALIAAPCLAPSQADKQADSDLLPH